MKTIVIFVSIYCGLIIQALAQDPQFSQFYANPLYLNPAFAGSEYCPRFCLNYRNQWPNISGTYVTYSASLDRYLPTIHGGIGAIATNDNQAKSTLKTTTFSLVYSYHAALGRHYSLKLALQGTYFQKTLDRNKLNFGDMIDPRRGFVWNTNEAIPQQQKQNLDFTGGLLLYSEKIYAGISLAHLNQPNEGLIGVSKLPLKTTIHAGAKIQINKGNHTFISPNILFQQQQNFMQLNVGMYVMKENFVLGLWYRNQDAAIILIGIQNKQIKVGYSYDVTLSRLANNTAGSHELSLQWRIGCKPAKPKFRPDICPTF